MINKVPQTTRLELVTEVTEWVIFHQLNIVAFQEIENKESLLRVHLIEAFQETSQEKELFKVQETILKSLETSKELLLLRVHQERVRLLLTEIELEEVRVQLYKSKSLTEREELEVRVDQEEIVRVQETDKGLEALVVRNHQFLISKDLGIFQLNQEIVNQPQSIKTSSKVFKSIVVEVQRDHQSHLIIRIWYQVELFLR